MVVLIVGCIEKKEGKPSYFKTGEFRIGDKFEYELWGKMIYRRDVGYYTKFYTYSSIGKATIEIKEAKIEDGFGNEINVIDFQMTSYETPYNRTGGEEKEDLTVDLEKHIYRIYEGNVIGGIIKSITIHHAWNRDRHIEINCYPINDFIDFFLQKEFMEGMNGSYIYEGKEFTWKTEYDKDLKALRINIKNENNITSIWIKNGYPLPYKIVYKMDNEVRNNTYSFILKEYKKGKGKNFKIGSNGYNSSRNAYYEKWKNFMSPLQGNNSRMKMSLRDAVAKALSYEGLKEFMRKNDNVYLVYAEYWEKKNEAGWILHFGNEYLRKDYVLNVSNANKEPIPSYELSPYLAYKDIPKNFEELNDKLMVISDAESIFEDFINYDFKNFSFRISYIEIYYPDTLFDIWEGNSKDKEIIGADIEPQPRSACLIDGFYKLTRDYAFGYRLVGFSPPFIIFDGKLNGMNGMVTYIYYEEL